MNFVCFYRFSSADVEVEDGYVEVAQVGQEAAISSEEALAVAKFHACPACLGRGLCQVGGETVSRLSSNNKNRRSARAG